MDIETDLKLAFETLKAKKGIYDKLWNYYDGNQPLRYSSSRLKEIFKSLDAKFTQNWCEVVVDSVLERQYLRQFVVPNDEQATKQANELFEALEMDLDADDVHLCALVTGEAFVVAWLHEGGVPEIYYNDSRLIHAFYEEENPRNLRMAAKWWVSNKKTYLRLFYPDVVVDFEADTHEPTQAGAFKEIAHEPHTQGRVPVWHFRRERRAIKSELSPSVLDTQDAINKLFADMMVSGEFGAFRQRYVISNAELGVLKNAPNEIWDLPAGDGLSQPTTVGEFSETNLTNYMNSMQSLASSIGKMTRTPASYFWLGARSDPSGEALMAMEGPLNKKTEKYNRRHALVWEKLMQHLTGVAEIRAVYADPRTVQPLTQAQTRQANTTAGLPLRTQLRAEGWTQSALEQMEADKQAEVAAQQTAIGNALLAAEREFAQNGEGVTDG